MKVYPYVWLIFAGFFYSNTLFAQQGADTLALRLDQTRKDSTQVRILLQLARIYTESDLNQAKSYGERAIQVAEEAKDLSGKIEALAVVGEMHERLFHFEQALYYYLQSLELIEKKKLPKKRFPTLFYRLGRVYQNLRNTEEALKFLTEAKESQKPALRQEVYKALAEVYAQQNTGDSAVYYYNASMQVSASEDWRHQAHCLEKIGEVYVQQKSYERAVAHYEQALQIYQKRKDPQGMAIIYNDLGQVYLKMNLPAKALEYLQEGLREAQKSQDKKIEMESYERLSAYFEHINNYDQSLEYYRKYLSLNDSLFNEENSQRMEKLKISYELDKAQGQLLLLQQEKILREAELQRKGIITLASVLLGILAFVFGVYMYKTSRRQKTINEELHAGKEEIESQKEEIENQKEELARLYEAVQSQHDDIQHSILYAKRIQEAMLPDIQDIQAYFPESFALFLPKDLVSGDLYWFAELGAHALFQEAQDMSGNRVFMGFESPKVVIAAVDCTGHGVPGGFMSMIAHNALNDIVVERHITSPDEILRQLHLHVQKALRQQTSKIQDGMDIALCVIDVENRFLEYAGAKSPLIYIQHGQLHELRPDRYSIGGLWNEELYFQKHRLSLEGPTSLYLCSDGFQDQFGGPQNRKFMKNRFKDLLLSLHELPMQAQQEALQKTLEEWKGQEAQTDDILILGLQV